MELVIVNWSINWTLLILYNQKSNMTKNNMKTFQDCKKSRDDNKWFLITFLIKNITYHRLLINTSFLISDIRRKLFRYPWKLCLFGDTNVVGMDSLVQTRVCNLRVQTAIKSILPKTLWLDQLQNFSFLSSNSFSRKFWNQNFLKKFSTPK